MHLRDCGTLDADAFLSTNYPSNQLDTGKRDSNNGCFMSDFGTVDSRGRIANFYNELRKAIKSTNSGSSTEGQEMFRSRLLRYISGPWVQTM